MASKKKPGREVSPAAEGDTSGQSAQDEQAVTDAGQSGGSAAESVSADEAAADDTDATQDDREAALAALVNGEPASDNDDTAGQATVTPTGVVHDWQPDGDLYLVTCTRYAFTSPNGRRMARRGHLVQLDDTPRTRAAVAAGALTPHDS